MVDSLTLRNARAQAFIDVCGDQARLKFYDGALPNNGDTPTGVKLGTLTAKNEIATLENGVLKLSTTLFSQTASTHVNGNPTFIRFETSDGSFIRDVPIADGGAVFNGSIKTGTKIIINSLLFTEP